MATPIGGQPPEHIQPPESLETQKMKSFTPMQQLINIGQAYLDGNDSSAISQINSLIKQLQAQEPQTSGTKKAIQDLEAAKKAIQTGKSKQQVFTDLAEAGQALYPNGGGPSFQLQG